MQDLLGTDINTCKVLVQRAELLNKELNIFTYRDLLYFPYKYIDRTKIYSISELNQDLPMYR